MGKKNKKQTVGYKYFVGAHLVLCHGPIDRILQIYVDDKLLWAPLNDGDGTGVRGNYENIHVHAPDLFGGEDREGGISGDIEVGMGYLEQGRNGYLSSVLANKLIPAYRGVVSVILKQIYCGTSPYLKPWKVRAQRIWAPTATDKPQWAPSVAGIGTPGDLFALAGSQLGDAVKLDDLKNKTKYDAGGFLEFTSVVDGVLYTVSMRVVYEDKYNMPITASTASGITITENNFKTGKATSWEGAITEIPRRAPYDEFSIHPLVDDHLLIDGGRKVLFPLCHSAWLDASAGHPYKQNFRYYYAAVLDLVEKTVTRIRYPAHPAMDPAYLSGGGKPLNPNRRVEYPYFVTGQFYGASIRSRLHPRCFGAWDDDPDGKYTVLGQDGHSFQLTPLRGEVTQLYNSSPISSGGYLLGYQKAPQRRVFACWYETTVVNGVNMDRIYAGIFDTETGARIWGSGQTLVPGGAFLQAGWPVRRVALDGHLRIHCPEDRFAYVELPLIVAAYFGCRFLVYNTASASGSYPETTNLGLPWFALRAYVPTDPSGIPTQWGSYNQSLGVTRPALRGADGLLYAFALSAGQPGYILTPGLGPGLKRGTARQMAWTPKYKPVVSYPYTPEPGAPIKGATFMWHGTPMLITSCGKDLSGIVVADADAGMAPRLQVGVYDMNPIHIIRECMTNTEWGRGLPESIIGPTYTTAAETIYNEGLGLSMLWTSEMAVNDFILEVIRHIDAVRYEDPETGLQEIKLIRPDYDVATLPVLSPSNCSLEQLTEPTLYDLVNQVTVNFWNRDTGEDSAIAAQDTASINMTGTVNNQAMEYSGICSTSVALMVAQRDLARYSKPFRQGRLIVNRKVANLKPGDAFVLTWPARGIDKLVCRAALRSDNGELDGQLGIEFGEDIFSQSYNIASVPPPSGWEDPITPPKNFDHVTMFDVPYVMLVDLAGEVEAAATPNDTSYAGFAGARPLTGMHLQYGCFVYPAGTTPPTDSQKEIRESFTPLGITGEDVAQFTDPVITLPLQVANDMSNARVGDWILVGNAADRDREVLCVAEEPGNTPAVIKVTRATADTYPRAIPKGTPLYLVGTFYAYDEIERVSGEAVAGYGAPKNGKGSYPGPFTYLQIDMVGRQGLPYPAAGFQVNGSYQDDLATAREVVTLTWHHRNRIQQANQALSWLASSDVPMEAGVSYQVRQVALDDAMAVISELPVLPAGQVSSLELKLLEQPYPVEARFARLTVEAVKGGRVSLQNRPVVVALPARLRAPLWLSAEFQPSPAAPFNLSA